MDANPKLQGGLKRDKPVFVISETITQQQVDDIGDLIIVAVSTRGARDLIRNSLQSIQLLEMRDFILAA